jgi:hypothetical protein
MQTAMTLSAFWACLVLKGGTIGSMPLGVFDGYGEKFHKRGHRRAAVQHPARKPERRSDADRLLGVRDDLADAARQPLCAQAEGRRQTDRPRSGRPDIVSVRRRQDKKIGYRWSWEGESFDLTEDDVFHVRGFGGGPLGGLSTIAYAREEPGHCDRGRADRGRDVRQRHEAPGALSFKDRPRRRRRNLARNEDDRPVRRRGKCRQPLILEGGSTWESIQMNADDAQLLRAGLVGGGYLPLDRHAAGDDRAHDEDDELADRARADRAALPEVRLNTMLRRIEQAIRKQLLTPAERARGLFAEFNLEGLLRGDSHGPRALLPDHDADRRDDAQRGRAKENLPPIDGGDVITIQSQNVPLEQLISQSVEDGLQKLLPEYLAAALSGRN